MSRIEMGKIVPFNDRSERVEISEEDRLIGEKTYKLFIHKLIRQPAWNIKNGTITITKTGEKIDGLDRENITPELARVVTGFKMVEDLLPDYMGQGNKLVRNNMGLFMINTQWGREELNHGLVLGNILEQTGHKTEGQIVEEYQKNLERTFELPYPTARKTSGYATFQEAATCFGYMRLGKRAEKEGATKTARSFELVAGDESYHRSGYMEVMKIYYEMDPEGTVQDILDVARNFRMPAENLHPNPLQWMKDLIRVGVFNKDLLAEDVIYRTLAGFRFIPEQLARKTTDEFLRK